MNDEEDGIVSVPHSSFILIHLIGCYNIASLFCFAFGAIATHGFSLITHHSSLIT